ncbi:MAG: hypothetical protein IJH39_11795 [Clostridia bacterium]|nr:hypothetical protein [Clostridia bacterium]
MMDCREINNLLLKVNRICFGDRFKKAFIEKFKYLPGGLTYHCYFDDDLNLVWFLTLKKYGYEHSFNDGVTDDTDASDFDIGNGEITDEMREWVKNYFIHYETEFYNKYMS